MSVKDGEDFLEQSIRSVLEQTEKDFEFLIVDDGSSDRSRSIVESFQDSRIHVLTHDKPAGLAVSLNELMDRASGKYWARMDADDIADPNRFRRQSQFLDAHPDITVLGTQFEQFGSNVSRIRSKSPTHAQDLAAGIVFGPNVCHPTVMFRSSRMVSFRYEALPYAQDYELWTRMILSEKFANLKQSLLHYRVHPKNAGSRVADREELVKAKIWKPLLVRIGLTPSEEELELHKQLCNLSIEPQEEFLISLGSYCQKLIAAIEGSRCLPVFKTVENVRRRYAAVFQYATHLGFRAPRYFRDKMSRSLVRYLGKRPRWFVKSLMKWKK